MKRAIVYITASFAVLLTLAALGISAAVDSPRTLMSRDDFSQGRMAIEARARAALARCHEAQGRAQDVCKAQARADERVEKADLQARYHGTVAAALDARLVHAKARYDVAKTRCIGRKGEARYECLRAAREDKAKALEAATLSPT